MSPPWENKRGSCFLLKKNVYRGIVGKLCLKIVYSDVGQKTDTMLFTQV